MKASIYKGYVSFTGKLSEEIKIINICDLMMSEFDSLCFVECFGIKTGNDMVEISMCYSPNEATVKTLKESYSDAKNMT
jgi:hypothetical protein